jgi:hypothetical protein
MYDLSVDEKIILKWWDEGIDKIDLSCIGTDGRLL